MKKKLFLLASVLLLFALANPAIASDVYAEYQISGLGNKPIISKMYVKNGDFRTDMNVNFSGMEMKNTSLMLKSNPGVIINFNSTTKYYTENKRPKTAVDPEITIKILGNEKVGNYNCTRVKMTSKGKSYDVWFSKDLPALNIPMTGIDALGSQKAAALLKSKGITGIFVKVEFLQPGSATSKFTMELKKYETKPLSSSLFVIPAGYKKSTAGAEKEKIKQMTTEQKKDLLMKMMKEQKKN